MGSIAGLGEAGELVGEPAGSGDCEASVTCISMICEWSGMIMRSIRRLRKSVVNVVSVELVIV